MSDLTDDDVGARDATPEEETMIAEIIRGRAAVTAAEKRADAAEAALSEMARRRDEWKAKAEGYDAVRMALREKVTAPWPPSLSRVLWAGIAADEKSRADAAEAEVKRLREALGNIRELNLTAEDENGHQWANSDLIEQEIVFALAASTEGR